MTVTDTDNNFLGMETKAYTVTQTPQTPFHDLLIHDITVNPFRAYPGVNVTVGVTVVNNGTTQENYDLAVSYRFPTTTTIFGSVTNQVVSSPGSSSFNFVLHTAGLAPGIYALQANVTVLPSSSNPTGVDNIPANNVALTEFIILRPDQPPVSSFTFSPQNPIVGLPVSFDGSGSVDPDGYITDWLWSFGDGQFGSDSFVTHVYSSAGSYTVTLTVLDDARLRGVQSAIIHVLAPTTNNLSVSVSVGSVYFPGDTADIYVLVATGGTPISASAMNVTLVRPDGSKVMLGAVSIALGLYKASFSIPSTGPLGTYAIIVHVHTTGAGDGSALGTFEAKPSWLSAQGPKIAAGTAVIGIVSALVVWRGGYLRKKDGASSSF